jgi:hypothetical protein
LVGLGEGGGRQQQRRREREADEQFLHFGIPLWVGRMARRGMAPVTVAG